MRDQPLRQLVGIGDAAPPKPASWCAGSATGATRQPLGALAQFIAAACRACSATARSRPSNPSRCTNERPVQATQERGARDLVAAGAPERRGHRMHVPQCCRTQRTRSPPDTWSCPAAPRPAARTHRARSTPNLADPDHPAAAPPPTPSSCRRSSLGTSLNDHVESHRSSRYPHSRPAAARARLSSPEKWVRERGPPGSVRAC
jgi:hypothetical protein